METGPMLWREAKRLYRGLRRHADHDQSPMTADQLQLARNSIGHLRNRGLAADAAIFERALGLAGTDQTVEPPASGLDRVHAVMGDIVISSLHFRELSTPDDKHAAFRQAVRYVDVEIFSQCNRRCH